MTWLHQLRLVSPILGYFLVIAIYWRALVPADNTDLSYRASRNSPLVAKCASPRDCYTLDHTPVPAKNLILYELYDTRDAWPRLHSNEPYQAACLVPGELRPASTDIDLPAKLELLQDGVYQGLMCEHGGMLAIGGELDVQEGAAAWVGFTSWRAPDLAFALSDAALTALATKTEQLSADGQLNTIIYWAAVEGLFPHCNTFHIFCDDVVSAVFTRLFAENGSMAEAGDLSMLMMSRTALPPLPGGPNLFSVSSYFAMHVSLVRHYLLWVRMVFVTLESLWGLHTTIDACPLMMGPPGAKVCWCVILERLVNVWAIHAGLHMVYLDPNSGELREQHPFKERQQWTHWFSLESIRELEQRFPARLSPDQLELYRRLG